jgi:Uri superfamily endonuclease
MKRGNSMNLVDILKISAVMKLAWQPYDLETHEDIGGGIYRFYDKEGNIIYVGKTNNLKRRLHQHYGKDTNSHYFIDEVVRHEVFIENNHILRTLLEGIFIAFLEPKYNDEVKDERERVKEGN